MLDADARHRPGTALGVDRLVTMTRLAGEPRTVLRACFDWQRFQAARAMYGGLYDWHTLEGPCVRKHGGHVLGPGHTSIVLGPDDETEFIVYHAWGPDMHARRMYVDPLRRVDGPRCDGPTCGP